jgi:hypothetical protein
MPGINVRDGGVWKNIPNGTKFNVRDGGVWKNPTKVAIRDGGVFKDVWFKSDPVTLSFDATAVDSFRLNNTYVWCPGGAGTCDYFFIGAFAGTFPRDYIGVAQFDSAALNTAMNTRPNVVSAEVRFRRDSTVGTSSASGTFFCGTYTDPVGGANPNYNKVNMANAGSQAFSSLGFSTDLTIPLTSQVVGRIRTGDTLAGSLRTSGWDTNKGSTDAGYSRWLGPATGSPAGRRPTLVVTLDF